MPSKKGHSPKATTILSIVIMLGLIITAVLYMLFANDKSVASEDIWNHFTVLSMLVVGYYFGVQSK